MALRVMGGFGKNDSYYLPRSRVIPSDALLNMIWPWLNDCYAWIAADDVGHPTAKHFLEFLNELRKVVLQDAAAMIAILRATDEESGDRRRAFHAVFTMEVFHTDEFESFVAEMTAVLVAEEEEDPNNKCIERALPGVARKFDQVIQELREVHVGTAAVKVAISEKGDDIVDKLNHSIQFSLAEHERRQAKRHKQTVSTISGFFKHGAGLMEQMMESEKDEDEIQEAVVVGVQEKALACRPRSQVAESQE